MTEITTADPAPVHPRTSWPRRILTWLLIVILVLLLFIGVAVAVLMARMPKDSLDPMKPGRLTMSTSAQPALRFGPFRAVVTSGDQAGISVTDRYGGEAIWATAPGVSFVSAGMGTVSFRDKFGAFWADVHREARMTEQNVTGVSVQGNTLTVTGTVAGQDVEAPFTLRLSPVRKSPRVTGLGLDLSVGPTTAGQPVSSVMLTSNRDDGEEVYGLGEQYRNTDLTGSVIPILTREQGVGRGEQPVTFMADITQWAGGNATTTYAPWPAYLTSANRSLTFNDVPESGAFTIADLTTWDHVSLEAWNSRIRAEALVGDSPADVMAQRAAGQRRPPLADWVQRGAVLGLQGGTQTVEDIVAQMQQAGTKISAVWLQDWTGQRVTSFGDRLWWTWQLDNQRYPGWDHMVKKFADQGIRVLTYVNPWLVNPAGQGGPPVKNLYAEAEKKGYLVTNSAGEPYAMDQNGFDAVLVDFTNPAARDWFADVIANDVLGVGASGFMADFGEDLPFDGVLYRGTPLTEHNRYPQLWAQTVREGCRRAGKPDCVAFMRSAFLGSASDVPLMWAGDQMVDFSDQDGLASAIYGMLDGGVSGFPLSHSDIGGYTSLNVVLKNYVRPPNLNARWAEMQSFGVVMRTHQGNRPAVNQQVYSTPETASAFARSSQIYAALYEYRHEVIEEATATGVPAMRPVWMVTSGKQGPGVPTQFFLGEHLFVAPVVSENATSVDVGFPPGTWVHVLTGEVFQGGQTTTVQAPLGTPAAFVRQGDPTGQQIRAALQEAGLTTG